MTSHPTRAALQRAAVSLLEEHPEDDVTVEMVLTASGASKGSLYHHYRDFDSLLDLAQATRFAASVDRTTALLRDTVIAPGITGALAALATGTMTAAEDAVREDLLAIAHARPSLRPLIAPEQRRLTDVVASLVREAQQRGQVRADVDARDVALLVQACASGRVVARIAAVDRWPAHVEALLRPLLEPMSTGPTDTAIPAARTLGGGADLRTQPLRT